MSLKKKCICSKNAGLNIVSFLDLGDFYLILKKISSQLIS